MYTERKKIVCKQSSNRYGNETNESI